jgi:predicted DNA-binding transcriptional regulator AlpA
MNDQSTNPFAPFFTEIRAIFREEIQQALSSQSRVEDDRLLTAEEAAKAIGVSSDWLYRHSKQLPFTRKLGPKMLRFSWQGIQKYLAIRKLSS